MKTSTRNTLLKGSTNRVNDYVSKLAHPTTLKYVKGISRTHKTLMGVCLERQNNGDFLKLTNKELKAWEMPTHSDHNGMSVMVDVTVSGRLNLIPVDFF